MFFTLREHCPFWPKQVCAAEFQGLEGIQFHYLVS